MARSKQIDTSTLYFPQRLLRELGCMERYPLTLLEAPSGFGKTTALKHYFDNVLPPSSIVLQYSFSPEKPAAAWKAVCALMGRFDPETADLLLAAGTPCEDNLPELKELFGQLRCVEETYLVLDDFVFWQIPDRGAFLMALAGHGGEKLHIVVASRLFDRDEHKQMSQSRSFCLLQESTLAFSVEEIDAYYRQSGVVLTPIQLSQVWQLTGGWVMALYMQMITFLKKGVFESVGTETLMRNALWQGLQKPEQDFLLRLSIFSYFSLSQAAEIFGRSLEKTENFLREKRVFIRYDRENRQYTMHSLLLQFLYDQFHLLPEEEKRDIYLLGGQLSEKANDPVRTLRFYYRSGNWERLLAMPLTSFDIADAVDETTAPMILDIMENLTHEMKVKYPKALVPLAFTLFILGQNKALLQQKDEIQDIIAESDLPHREKNALQGELELLLSFLEYNRIDAMSERHRRALELLDGPATLISVKSTWTFGSPSVMYMFWREPGKLDEELGQMDECMPYYYALTRGHGTGAELVMRAEAHLHRGEIGDAENLCHRAVFTADARHQSSIAQCAIFALARLAILSGNRRLLEDSRAVLLEHSHRNTEDLCRYTYDLADGYLSLLLGQQETADWLRAGKIDDTRLVIMAQPFAYILYGRMLLEKKEYQKLLGAGGYALGISGIFPNLLPQVYLKIYMAQALLALHKEKEAAAMLAEALALALPDRVILPFAENYEGIKKLLPVTDCPREARDRIYTLARSLTEGLSALDGILESLSPRERQIAALIKEDRSYAEIAEELGISISTVKTNVKRISVKTGANSKTKIALLSQ